MRTITKKQLKQIQRIETARREKLETYKSMVDFAWKVLKPLIGIAIVIAITVTSVSIVPGDTASIVEALATFIP